MPAKRGRKGKPTAKPKKVSRKLSSTKASKKAPAPKVKNVNKVFLEQDKSLTLALDIAQMGVWIFDFKARSVQWSGNVHLLFGLARESFDGTFEGYLNVIHPEDREKVIKNIEEALARKESCYIEHRIIWPDGSIHWMASIGKLTINKDGKPVRITGTVQDISRKKLIEEEREDWKTRLELISASAGLVIYDYHITTGDIIWSGNIEIVLGYTPLDLGNIDRWVELIHPEDRDEAFRLLEVSEKELKPYDVYYRFQKLDGNYCHIHDRGFFIVDRNGKAVRMLGMMNDVSERILAEQTIREGAQFRESIENAIPDMLYVRDLKNQRNIYANRNFSLQLGYISADSKNTEGQYIEYILHPEDIDRIPRWSNEPNGFVKETEVRVKRKDGNYCWILTRDTPFQWDSRGNVTHIIGIAQDITQRKEAIEQLNKSEASYRELFDTVGEAICIQEADGTFVDVNKGACNLFGYEKSALIGRTPQFLSAEGQNDFGAINARMKKALEGKPQTFEFWGRKKNGELFLQEIRLTRGSYFGKQIIISTGRDITQRRNTEQALRDSEQRFRTLQQASFGGIGLHDKGIIIDCNQGLCDITGYSYEELIGYNGLLLIAPEWRDLAIQKIQTGYDKPYDVEGLRKDGTRYMLEVHGKSIPYEGRPIRVTEFRDVTERKRSEEKIIQQNAKLHALTEDLRRKNNQLEEFTQIVSHNLRSPVGNIVTLLNFFEGARSDDERMEYFNLIKEASATTLYMLNDLNEVLKIRQTRNIETQQLNFDNVLQHVKNMLSAKISQSAAEVTSEFQSPTINYPGIYLESILLNLLDNALKYSHPERIPKIHFKTYNSSQGHIVMEVKDNGLGLNLQRYGHHIFKLRKTFHRHPESRGIGLFMIKNQIETMGGDITIESQENEGSTFFVNFNKTQPDAA